MKILFNRLLRFFTHIKYFPRAFRLILKPSKKITLVWFLSLIIQGILPVTIVVLIKKLVDQLVIILKGNSSENWESVLYIALFLAFIMLLTETLNSIIEWSRIAQSENIEEFIRSLIHEQATNLDISFYESPEYHDHLERALHEAQSSTLTLLENSGTLIQNGITLLAMVSILVPYGLWLPALLLLSILPGFYVVLKFNWRYHQWWKQSTENRRWADYNAQILTTAAFAPEIRLFGLAKFFQDGYLKTRKRLREERIAIATSQAWARFWASSIALLITGAIIIVMIWRATMGLVTLGDLTLFYQAFNRGQTVMRGLLRNLGQIYSNSLFLGNLFEFLEIKSKVTNPANPAPIFSQIRKEIVFREVGFRYPASDRLVLDGFNLTIPGGKVIAIVGPNGAGKSTIVKLLCRFYDPESGSIHIDGLCIKDFSMTDYHSQITALFQFPMPYYISAAKNILLGNLNIPPSRSKIENAARQAGSHEFITRLPNGYDTTLGKWFGGGTELSGGEWQRIALSRAFYRDAPLIILDEPTSFMDSWAEADWMDRFKTLAKGKTSVIITHRFTTAMRADIIYVMQQGAIVEWGTHDELLMQNGHYAESWYKQMGNKLNEV